MQQSSNINTLHKEDKVCLHLINHANVFYVNEKASAFYAKNILNFFFRY